MQKPHKFTPKTTFGTKLYLTMKESKRKKEAIALLNIQKKKLRTNGISFPWAAKTKSIILEFFGQHSAEYEYAATAGIEAPNIVNDWILFLEDCIHTIGYKNTYRKPYKNWFYKLPTWFASIVVASAISGVGFGAYQAGLSTNDSKLIQAEIEIERLKSLLASFSTPAVVNDVEYKKEKPDTANEHPHSR